MITTALTAYTHPMQRDVAVFHDAFGMPNLIETPGPLPFARIELRIGLIREEGVVELAEAIEKNDPVAIIDALIDTVYVVLGALVEMGQDVDILGLYSDFYHLVRDEPLLDTARVNLSAITSYVGMLEAAFLGQSVEHSVALLRTMAVGSLLALTEAGIDPRPYFDEVQRANMSKLGADGKPVYSRGIELDGAPAGKVLKGANYSAPDLHAVHARQEALKDSSAPIASEYMRGARDAVDAMKSYFLNEDEGPLYEEISTKDLDSFEKSALNDVVRDERMRIERYDRYGAAQ